MSCSSRAMRLRSSATRSRARMSRSRSARSARSASESRCWRRRRRLSPSTNAAVSMHDRGDGVDDRDLVAGDCRAHEQQPDGHADADDRPQPPPALGVGAERVDGDEHGQPAGADDVEQLAGELARRGRRQHGDRVAPAVHHRRRGRDDEERRPPRRVVERIVGVECGEAACRTRARPVSSAGEDGVGGERVARGSSRSVGATSRRSSARTAAMPGDANERWSRAASAPGMMAVRPPGGRRRRRRPGSRRRRRHRGP